MKTTSEIIASLRAQLGREPTPAEIKAEDIRLGKQWYADMAVTAITLRDESESMSQPERTLEEVAKDLSERERRLLERVLKEHPQLTPEEALRHLRAAGM
jgi:DNA-directed RNA polymerase specialized sigma subunit